MQNGTNSTVTLLDSISSFYGRAAVPPLGEIVGGLNIIEAGNT